MSVSSVQSSTGVQASTGSAAIHASASADVAAEAQRIGASGDIGAAAEFVRANPEQRGRVESAMLAQGNVGGIGDLAEALGQAVQKVVDGVRGLIERVTGGNGVSEVTPTRTGFATADAAARSALAEANPTSIAENRELGGLVYRAADGTYGYTEPARGTGTSFDPTSVSIPSGTTLVGDYHTHADYSVAGPNGEPIRTSDPARDDYNSDQFSSTDLRGIANDANGRPGYRGYLGTPSGQFLVYDPATNRVSNLP